jgi:hypothetical protein
MSTQRFGAAPELRAPPRLRFLIMAAKRFPHHDHRGRITLHSDGRRSLAVWSALVLGILTVALTELESLLRLLSFVPVLIVWLAIAAGAVLILSRLRLELPPRPKIDSLSAALIACSLLITLAIAVTAWMSPPNFYDVIAYHLPRVVYWAQNRSLALFPSPYPQQNFAPPFAEYAQLQLYIVSRGGDRFPGLIQLPAFAGMVCVVSLIARELGARIRGQAIACLAAATIPAAVLQASDGNDDVFFAFWLVAMAWFALRYAKRLGRADLIGVAASFSLAFLTKGTAFALAPPLLLPAAYSAIRKGWRESAALACAMAVFALALNLPFQARISGPAARGLLRLTINHSRGLRPTLSNALRVAATLMGSRNDAFNTTLFQAVALAHVAMRQDLNDPRTTFSVLGKFEKPSGASHHEGNAANLIPVALMFLTLPVAIGISIRSRSPVLLFYCAGIILSYLGFCALFSYQPWHGRLLIGPMALGGALTGMLAEKFLPSSAQAVLAVGLVWSIFPYVTANSLRPLTGEHSIFRTQRESNYFRDFMPLEQPYRKAIRFVISRACHAVGIDYSRGAYQRGFISAYEFPVMALLSRHRPVRFYHPTSDFDVTAPYREPACAILCLDCARDAIKQQRYGNMRSTRFDPVIAYYTETPHGQTPATDPRRTKTNRR